MAQGKFQPKDGSGVMFPNLRKKSPNGPDWRGEAKINGTMMEVAGWTKIDKNGNDFISLSIQLPRQKPPMQRMPGNDPVGGARREEIEDSEIPF